MKNYCEIEIIKENHTLTTNGLRPVIKAELKIAIKERTGDHYSEVFKYIIDYILSSEKMTLANQTIAYYSWILKFSVQPIVKYL